MVSNAAVRSTNANQTLFCIRCEMVWRAEAVRMASCVPRLFLKPCCGSPICPSYHSACLAMTMHTASLHKELEIESARYIAGSFRDPLFFQMVHKREVAHADGTLAVSQTSLRIAVSSSR